MEHCHICADNTTNKDKQTVYLPLVSVQMSLLAQIQSSQPATQKNCLIKINGTLNILRLLLLLPLAQEMP